MAKAFTRIKLLKNNLEQVAPLKSAKRRIFFCCSTSNKGIFIPLPQTHVCMVQPQSLIRASLPYGFLFGSIMMLELVLSYLFQIDVETNKSYGLIINLLNYLILPFCLVYITVTTFIRQSETTRMALRSVVKMGVVLCMVAALISGLFNGLFDYLIPNYFDEVYQKMGRLMRRQNPQMTQEQVDMALGMIKKMRNPLIAVPIGILMFSILGLFHGFIVGLIVKKGK